MKLRKFLTKHERYSALAAVAPGGWCCHCHCCIAAVDGGYGDGCDPYYGCGAT